MLDELDLLLPNLPEVLSGLRIAHISDLHVVRHRRRHQRIVREAAAARPDLVMFTGDYMNWSGHEAVTLAVLKQICEGIEQIHRSRLGMFGVFGNHDSPSLRRAARSLPVQWLDNDGRRVEGLPLEIWGADTHYVNRFTDGVALARRMAQRNGHVPRPMMCDLGNAYRDHPVRLLMCHMPTFLPTAADLEMDLMFAGHTHGGQCRLPGKRALVNSSDLPLHLTSGILRHRHTLCVVSRGLGEVLLPLRVFCRVHLPVYTLRPGSRVGEHTHDVHNVAPW